MHLNCLEDKAYKKSTAESIKNEVLSLKSELQLKSTLVILFDEVCT